MIAAQPAQHSDTETIEKVYKFSAERRTCESDGLLYRVGLPAEVTVDDIVLDSGDHVADAFLGECSILHHDHTLS